MSDANNLKDITIYGATGFLARHICRYLISVLYQLDDETRKSIRLTLAGRNEEKLKSRLSEMCDYEKQIMEKSSTGMDWEIFIADCEDSASLKEMAKKSAVVINCAGPYTKYGTNVVEACATAGTDYVDITAEVEWFSRMRREFGALSAKSGSRIISNCGFDSIPSDFSVFASVQKWKQTVLQLQKEPLTLNIKSAKTWHSVLGFINGGTLHTALEIPVNVGECLFDENKKLRPFPFLLFDPFCLVDPKICYSRLPAVENWKYISARSEWMNNFLTIDPELQYGASIPFFMAVCNNKVVHASAVALKYSPILDDDSNAPLATPFTYKERMTTLPIKQTRMIGLFSIILAIYTMACVVGIFVLFKLPYIGKRLAHWILPPGSGSSDAMNEMGHTEVLANVKGEVFSNGELVSNDYPDRASCHIHFEGDAGNLVTAQCVVESALSLLLNRSELPQRSVDGFGTPAQLLGNVFLKRLMNTAVRPVRITTKVWKDGKEYVKSDKKD